VFVDLIRTYSQTLNENNLSRSTNMERKHHHTGRVKNLQGGIHDNYTNIWELHTHKHHATVQIIQTKRLHTMVFG
jgi:formylglycine-generating enzyme required for sulfatase activity